MSQLPADCLKEIFEFLEEDDDSLRSCLFVSRLWCEVSVEILWRSIRNYNTLIACLPKEILDKNEMINNLILTSKPPTFNYAKFCKVLSIKEVNDGIKKILECQQSISPQNLNEYLNIITEEVLKCIMNQSSLRKF